MPFLRYLPLSVLLLLLLAGAWWQGLYFEDQQVVAVFLLLLAALFSLVFQRFVDKQVPDAITLLVFALPLVLLISSVSAVSPHNARLGWMQYLALAGVFVVVRQSVKNSTQQVWILAAILSAAIWICLFGLLAKAGLADFPAAVTKGRIGSVFQYANSFGTFAGACLLGSLAVLFLRAHPLRHVALAGLPVLLWGLVFSYSRGAWLLVVPVFLLLLWLQPAPQKFRLAGYAFLLLLPSVLLLPLLQRSFHTPPLVLLLLAVAIALTWFADRILIRLADRRSTVHGGQRKDGALLAKKLQPVLFLVIAVATVGLLVALFTGISEKITGSASDTSFTARVVFISDALRIFRDYPVTGAGGGAWPILYESYQSQPYYSTQIHNYLLQVLTDAGLSGLVVFLAVLFLLFRAALRSIRSATVAGAANSCFFVAVAGMIFLHSLLDFDLTFFYLAVVLFTALAAAVPLPAPISNDGISPQPQQITPGKKGISNGIFAVIVLWLCWAAFLSLRQISASRENEQGNQLAQAGRYAEALPAFEAAARLAPYHLGYLQASASVTEAVARYNSNTGQLREGGRQFRRLTRLEPLNPKSHQALAGFFERNGQPDSAFLTHNRALQIAPYNWNYYEALLQFSAKAARAGTLSKAAAEKALGRYRDLEARKAELKRKGIKHRRRFAYTETMHLHAAQLAYQLADYNRSAALAKQVLGSANPKAQQLAQAYWQLSNQYLGSANDSVQLATGAPERQLEAVRNLPRFR